MSSSRTKLELNYPYGQYARPNVVSIRILSNDVTKYEQVLTFPGGISRITTRFFRLGTQNSMYNKGHSALIATWM